MCLFPAERQIADPIDHEQFRTHHDAVEVLLEPRLALSGAQLLHQIGSRHKACHAPVHQCSLGQSSAQMTLTHTAGPSSTMFSARSMNIWAAMS